MEKRVVIFLVLSLAVILGYDLLLKQFGLLPPTPTVQEPEGQEATAPRGQTETPAVETPASTAHIGTRTTAAYCRDGSDAGASTANPSRCT